MTILQRYVCSRIATAFLAVSGGALLLVWVVQALQRVNLITDGGSALTSFLWIALLILPRVMTVVLPFALVIAVVAVLNALNDESETVVVSASGGGRRTFVLPVLVLAALVSFAQLLVAHALEPTSRQAFRHAIAEARADVLSSLLREGQFRELGDDVTVHVDSRAAGGRLGGLMLEDRREEGTTRTYYAREASVAEREGTEFVLMQDGEVHERDLESGAIRMIEFATYALDLTNLSETDGGEPTLRPKDRDTVALLRPDPEDLGFQRDPMEYTAELHRRLSNWLYIWAFCAVALHAGARPRSTRETSASTMAFVLGTCLVLRGVGFALEDAAKNAPLAIPLLYAVPLGAAVLFGTSMFFDRRFVLPAGVRRLRNRAWDAAIAPVTRLRARFGLSEREAS